MPDETTSDGLSRRGALGTTVGTLGAAAAASTLPSSGPRAQETKMPKAKRFKMATIGVPDLDAVAPLYKDWLGYTEYKRGKVDADIASSWGAPESAGRPYVMMQPESGADVFIRAVEIDPVPDYEPMTTWGWNAIEIICDDPDAVYDKLIDSPFTHLGGPAGLTNYPSIRATQFKGVADDVLYLTAETGDRSNSLLPRPGAFIGRIFIMVVAGPDIQALQDFYADAFDMQRGPINNSPVDLINVAQGLPLGSERPLTTLRLAQHGNLFELDGYGDHTGPRPSTSGQLPPGISITSITVENLDDINLDFITEPVAAYDSRAATVVGPAGELLELIEEKS